MKILLISDIHLRAYHRFNKFPDQRLYSFVELARDIVEIGKSNGIDTLFITGDIIDKSTLTPKEIHVLFQMFTILADHFTIYSIVGNHDMRLKKGDFEREDSIVTLLEEIENVHFLHQKIIILGGRTLAFENWVPEFKLDWIKEPVDLYFSHATIDYDQTGFYGMDTTVFEGKFTLGFFGDIHVRRDWRNYVSVGNTKQESLSDRYQGGGVIINLEDLSWERFDIDPEHKKYLHLIPTEDLDEEGWVDPDGEDMTYRVYKPKKVSGKTLEFTLPKTADLEATLNQVMKDLNLLELHKEIKKNTNYQPIDFNFKLDKLIIENFRSIKDYTLDFSEDYVITGPNGSGKSTLITALFYALIGKKTLKSDISFGETSCKMVLHLTYQAQTFVLTRGTGAGDYGLSINGVDQKYNNKLEFEKDVYQHLPFLHYHEAFFMNYWDTELLGSLKLDRRFDLIAKFFRLDALVDYNDVGTLKLKESKRILKELKDKFEKDKLLTEAREEDLSIILKHLKGKPKLEVLIKLREDYKRRNELTKELQIHKDYYSTSKDAMEKMSSTMDNAEREYKSHLKEVENESTKEETQEAIKTFETREALQGRIDKGMSFITGLRSEIKSTELQLEQNKSNLSLIDPGKELEIPKDLPEEIEKINSYLTTTSAELTKIHTTISIKVFELMQKVDKCLEEIESNEKPSNCTTCGKPVSNEERLKFLNDYKDKLAGELDIAQNEYASAQQNLTNFNEIDKVEMESKREILSAKLAEINSHNNSVTQKAATVASLNSAIEVLTTTLKLQVSDEAKYSAMITELESELRSLNFISAKENMSNHILLSKYEKLDKLKVIFDNAETSYQKVKDEFTLSSADLLQKIQDREALIKDIPEIDSDENVEAALIIAEYNRKEEISKVAKNLKKELTKLEKSIEIAEKNFTNLDHYCQLTSRSGEVLKKTLEDLTKTFSNSQFRFSTNRSQASGKVVTDMTVEYLVGKNWITYPALSSGQKTLCDLYFISKVVTGVGIMSFDETLRFLDDENMKVASDIIVDIKKQNLLISSHSPNLYIEGVTLLTCKLDKDSITEITLN